MAQSSSTATIDGDIFGPVFDGVANNVVVDVGVSERFNTIDGTSYSGVAGVHSIQQNNGSANRVLSAMSVQIDIDPVGTPDVTTSASVEGRVSDNDVTRDDSDPDADVDRIAELDPRRRVQRPVGRRDGSAEQWRCQRHRCRHRRPYLDRRDR